MRTFKSKIDLWLILVLAIALLTTVTSLIDSFTWPMLLIAVVVWAFVIDLFWHTRYTIDNNVLRIQSGFLMKVDFDIHSIREIARTRTLISSPALSLDRLRIKCANGSTVVVSPFDKEGFLTALLCINPSIIIR